MNRYLTQKDFALQNKYGSLTPKDSSQSIKERNISSPKFQIYLNGRIISADQFHVNDGSMATLMQILVFCNEHTNGARNCEQRDFESTLLDFAASKGFHKKLFAKIVPKIAEVKVDGAESGMAAAIIELNGKYRMVIKDWPEKLLGRCNRYLFKGKPIPLTMNMIARIKSIYQQMTADGLHLIMLAFKDMEKLPLRLEPVFQSDGLTLVGMIGWHSSAQGDGDVD